MQTGNWRTDRRRWQHAISTPGGFCSEWPDVPVAGLTRFDVLEQGPAPASTIPRLPVTVSGLFHARFNSLIELEAAMAGFDAPGFDAPVFAVEEHWLQPT